MTKLLLAATAALALSACNSHKAADDNAANAAAANATAAAEANVAASMPPSIKASKTYRCKDQSLVYVNFMTGDMQANLREGSKTAAPVELTTSEAGKPFTAEGYSVSGETQTAEITRPGKPAQSCKSN